jgi:hypothetical protein
VEDALIAHRKAREGLVEQEAAVRASREALSIAEFRYTSGLTSYLNVLDAQRTLLTAEVAESRTLLSQLVAVVQLYRPSGVAGMLRRARRRRRAGDERHGMTTLTTLAAPAPDAEEGEGEAKPRALVTLDPADCLGRPEAARNSPLFGPW